MNSVIKKQKPNSPPRQSGIDELTDDFSHKAKINETNENSSDDNFNENFDVDLSELQNFDSSEIPFTINNRSNVSSPQHPPLQKPQPTYNPLANRAATSSFQPFGYVANNGFQNNPYNMSNINMMPNLQNIPNLPNGPNLQNLGNLQMNNMQGMSIIYHYIINTQRFFC